MQYFKWIFIFLDNVVLFELIYFDEGIVYVNVVRTMWYNFHKLRFWLLHILVFVLIIDEECVHFQFMYIVYSWYQFWMRMQW